MANNRPAVTPERLERAASRLRPMEREVLALSARERLSNGEIAVRLGITPRMAERLLARALCTLDRAIERQDRPWWKLW
jgi:DNA-directed RNA polymerase specialized sigma24 family protein